MRLTVPENFDGDATTDRLDPTWKAQVDLLDPTRRSTSNELKNLSAIQLPAFLVSLI